MMGENYATHLSSLSDHQPPVSSSKSHRRRRARAVKAISIPYTNYPELYLHAAEMHSTRYSGRQVSVARMGAYTAETTALNVPSTGSVSAPDILPVVRSVSARDYSVQVNISCICIVNLCNSYTAIWRNPSPPPIAVFRMYSIQKKIRHYPGLNILRVGNKN